MLEELYDILNEKWCTMVRASKACNQLIIKANSVSNPVPRLVASLVSLRHCAQVAEQQRNAIGWLIKYKSVQGTGQPATKEIVDVCIKDCDDACIGMFAC